MNGALAQVPSEADGQRHWQCRSSVNPGIPYLSSAPHKPFLPSMLWSSLLLWCASLLLCHLLVRHSSSTPRFLAPSLLLAHSRTFSLPPQRPRLLFLYIPNVPGSLSTFPTLEAPSLCLQCYMLLYPSNTPSSNIQLTIHTPPLPADIAPFLPKAALHLQSIVEFYRH